MNNAPFTPSEFRFTDDNTCVATQGDQTVIVHCHDEMTDEYTVYVQEMRVQVQISPSGVVYSRLETVLGAQPEPDRFERLGAHENLIIAACEVFTDVIAAPMPKGNAA